MNYAKTKHLSIESCISIQVLPKNIEHEESLILDKNLKNLFIYKTKEKKRQVLDLNILTEMAAQQKINEKFEKLLQKCRKIIKIEITSKQLLDLLMIYKGKSKDVLIHLVSENLKKEIDIIYEDCCSLSKQHIQYDKFLALYIKNDGSITSLYNYFAKFSKPSR